MTVLFRIMCLCALLGFTVNLQASPKLNGMSIHNELSEDQFVAAVYSETLTGEARSLLVSDEEKVMEIRVLTDTLYARRFTRMWIEGIAINAAPSELEKHAQHLADFSNLLRIKMMVGDILKIKRIVGKETVLELNGTTLGAINDPQFFDLLLRTWIGPVPLSSGFRVKLLANGVVDAETKQRFDATIPSAERIASVADALKSDATKVDKNSTATAKPDADKSTDKKPPVDAALPDAPVPDPAAVVDIPTPTEPEPSTPVVPEPSKPEPTPAQPAADAVTSEEDVFSDEAKDLEFTAAGLLSEQVYISKLAKWTGSYVKYPRSAQQKGHEGNVRLKVTIGRNGKVLNTQLLEKAEHEALNRAAAQAVKKASPYPAIPDSLAGDTFVFAVPIAFRLQPNPGK